MKEAPTNRNIHIANPNGGKILNKPPKQFQQNLSI